MRGCRWGRRALALAIALLVAACQGDDAGTSETDDTTGEGTSAVEATDGSVGTTAGTDATSGGTEGETEVETSGETDGIPMPSLPAFVKTNYIALEDIGWVSKFRSGVGHDYSDNYESCRSMKHYFYPFEELDWSAVELRSPVAGTVLEIEEEWAGARVVIESAEFPEIRFTLFHVNLTGPLADGVMLAEGEVVGTHIGDQTFSDIAVSVHTPQYWRLVSYLDVMSDELWAAYSERGGVSSRTELIITRAERDAQPLSCADGQFSQDADPEDWVALDPGDAVAPPSSAHAWTLPYAAP